MEKKEQNQEKSYRIRDVFDQILVQHFERLIGSRLGINGLPLNLMTIAALILFAEREIEIANFPQKPPSRYTDKTLFHALKEIGLDYQEDAKPVVQEMISKGYVQANPQGRYLALKPVTSMVQLLEKVFPKMPGLSLIAYFLQTIDEIQSSRKDLDSGARLFHAMLRQQGQPLIPAEIKARQAEPPASKKETETKERQVKTIAEVLEIDASQLSKLNEALLQSGTVTSANILSAEAKPEYMEVKKVEMMDVFSSERQMSPAAPPPNLPPSTPEAITETAASTEVPPERVLEKDSGVSEIWMDESFEKENEEQTEVEEEVAEKPLVESGPLEDESIASRIAAFQDELALQCPICHTGKIRSQKTASGSVYFRCTSEGCNFISWGQPYYMACPQCQNPFLIETSQQDGSLILKCPRATCRYWQKHPAAQMDKPKVQRRLVRRPKRRVIRRIVKK